MKENKDSLKLVKMLNDFTDLPFQPMEIEGKLCAGLTTDEKGSAVIIIRMGQLENTSLVPLKKIADNLLVKKFTDNLSINYIPLSKISKDIVQLENKLSDRNGYFDLLYSEDHKQFEIVLKKIKESRSSFIATVYSQGMDDDTYNFCKDLVMEFSKVFIAYEQLKLKDFTSANNRKKSDQLLKDLLFEVEEFFKFLIFKDLTPTKSHLTIFSFNFFDFFKRYGETAERWSANFEIDTQLWSSPIYLNLLVQFLNNCIVYTTLKYDINYIEKILLYGSQALESKNIDPIYQLDLERNLNSLALLAYVESQNFQAALNLYDNLISKFQTASYKDKWPTILPILKNLTPILNLFKFCLSSQMVEKTNLLKRISDLKTSLRRALNILHAKISSRSDTGEMIYLNSVKPLIENFIQELEIMHSQTSVKSNKNSKKKNKKKKAEKNKSSTTLPEKKPDTLKSEEDKINIPQTSATVPASVPESASKDNRSYQASALVPPQVTVRISRALIEKDEQDRKNKYLRKKNRGAKKEDVESRETKTVFYPLSNKFMPGNKKIQAIITIELLDKLPLSWIAAAIQVLKGGMIGIKKNQVHLFTEADRQRNKVPPEVTYGMTLTGKIGACHLFAQWSKKIEATIEFNSTDHPDYPELHPFNK